MTTIQVPKAVLEPCHIIYKLYARFQMHEDTFNIKLSRSIQLSGQAL